MEPCRQILEREHPELFARVRSKELSVKEAVKEVAAMMKATPADPDEEAGGFAPGVLDAIKADQADEQTEEELNILVDHGVRVLDVVVEHQLYGELRGSLTIESRADGCHRPGRSYRRPFHGWRMGRSSRARRRHAG